MNIAIAGGGTGGHLFPGIALAEEFMRRDPDNKILFFGTKRGLESRILPSMGFQFKIITVKGLKEKAVTKQIGAFLILPWSFIQSYYFLKKFSPDIVLGVGGYISGPVLVAGIVLKRLTAIHEQNSFPGLSNRILGRFVQKVFISYEESTQFFPKQKAIVTGIPLRSNFFNIQIQTRTEPFCLLILGGSQGSSEINHAILEALPYLAPIREKLSIIHQSGHEEVDLLQSQYSRYGLYAKVVPFIENMAASYARAHLIVSRAGAVTLAEIALCGRAALLIPYPYAADSHQEKNARALVEKGAAMMMTSSQLSGKNLAGCIIDAEKNRSKIEKMEAMAKSLAKPKAAEEIVAICYQLITQYCREGKMGYHQ